MAPAAVTLAIGGTQQLTATLRDASGAVLTGRTVAWAASDSTKVRVSTVGVVTARAAGNAVVSASSEGVSGTATVTVSFSIVTGISDVRTFMEGCPTNDPAYGTIRQDFEVLSDGQPITSTFACSEPISALPVAQLTDELITMQVFRTAYYMSSGTAGSLPWTALGLYQWMKSVIAGVNLRSTPGLLYCCDLIGGKLYFSRSRQDAVTRDLKREWTWIAHDLAFFAHEIRHGAGGPGHVTGCPAFPNPTDPAGCDATYDLSNLGSYGIQYWLESTWASGFMNVGLGCAPAATALQVVTAHAASANSFRDRFVANAPPVVAPSVPYGGWCISP